MTAATPIGTGTFAKTPLSHLLVSLVERGLSGTVVFETPSGAKSALVLERGIPCKVRTAESVALGPLLVKLGHVDKRAAQETFAISREQSSLHGQVLLAHGLLGADELELALRAQIAAKLELIGDLGPDTVFGVYEGADYLAKWAGGATPVAPLCLIWRLIQHRTEPAVVSQVLAHVGRIPLRIHAHAQLEHFGFGRTELSLLEVLRARPQDIEALNQMGILASHLIERLVYALTITRHLDLGTGARPIGIGLAASRLETFLSPKSVPRHSRPVMLSATPPPGAVAAVTASAAPRIATGVAPANSPQAPAVSPLASPAAPAAAAAKSPAKNSDSSPPSSRAETLLLERRQALEQLAISIADKDLYEVLGVASDVPATAVQAAFFHLAKLHHPDRLGPGLADLRPLATRVFSRMTEAHQTLSDPNKRATYDHRRSQDASEDAESLQVQKVLAASASFQKADVLFKKRMLAAAELEAKRAYEGDPEQPDYAAFYAWILASKPDAELQLPQLLEMLDEAVKRNPESERNRYYRAQLLKRLGRIADALADCRLIVERNPHHTDALRELRLHNMRRGGSTRPGGSKSGANPSSRPRPSGGKSNPPQGSKGKASQPEGLLGKLFKR